MSHNVNIKRDFITFLDGLPSISVVCFDFFDTLVYRTVCPEHTKRLACRQLGHFTGGVSLGNDIYEIRRELEIRLCQENASKGFDPEFDISELADSFFDLLAKQYSGWTDLLPRPLFGELLIDIETRVETLVQRTYAETIELLQTVRKRGMQTAIASDFYFHTPHFNRFLDFHNLSELFDEIFISSDYKLTKATGRLYQKIIQHLGCPPESILMIGDNPHSDVRMAKDTGIHAFFVDRKDRKLLYDKLEKSEKSRTRTSSRLAKRIDKITRRLGGDIFPETAVSLWRFTHRLFSHLVQDGVKDLFFFSKEGEFLKRLFEQFQRNQFGRCVIRAHYLLVSRKSTFICSLKPLDEENFFRVFHQYREMAPRDFFLSLNFPKVDAIDLCRKISVDYEKREPHFGTSATFIKIVASSLFEQLYEKIRRQQKRNFHAYMNSFAVNFKEEGLHIVDVGWRGSIQDNIFFSFDGDVVVNGYYIGLLQPTNIRESNRKTGILFSEYPSETPFFEVYNSNRSFFEMMLNATHGSADGYDIVARPSVPSSKGVSPTDNQGVVAANVVVKKLDLPEERRLFIEHIQPIQKRIFEICREINCITALTRSPIPDAEWFARRHARMVYHPTVREVSFFENLYHLENFGIFEFTDFKGDGNPSIRQRVENLRQVIRQPDSVSQNGVWAPVALNRLGLKFCRRPFGIWCHKRVFSAEYKTAGLRKKEKFRSQQLRFKSKARIKIAFLLGIPEINGGTYVVFEHATRLRKKGYRVFILTEDRIDPQRYEWHPDAANLTWLTYRDAERIHFDFAIATWWMSVFYLHRVIAATYLYFIQSIETRFFPSEERSSYTDMMHRDLADNTYAIPLPVITEARWIQSYLKKNYGRKSSLVPNGIRKDLYSADGIQHDAREPGKVRVLVEGPVDVEYKNVRRTIELCRASDVDEVWLLTSSSVDAFPGVDRVFSQVPIWETPAVYRSCDIIVKLSYIEGMFGPPLEMFHCGGTAIVYCVTGHDEYICDGVNSIVLQPDDEDGVVACLNRLKHQPNTLEQLKNGAAETASKWPDWHTASDNFEKALFQFKSRLWPDQRYLGRITVQMWGKARNDMEWLKSLYIYREKKPVSDNCQIFWHSGRGFTEKDSIVTRFKCGKWINLKAEVSIPSGQIHIRIDPSMRAGVILFEQFKIREKKNNRIIYRCLSETNWDGLEISGTASIIDSEPRLIVDADGEDPQCLLRPFPVEEDNTDIVIDISMAFLPFPLIPLELKQCFSFQAPINKGISVIA